MIRRVSLETGGMFAENLCWELCADFGAPLRLFRRAEPDEERGEEESEWVGFFSAEAFFFLKSRDDARTEEDGEAPAFGDFRLLPELREIICDYDEWMMTTVLFWRERRLILHTVYTNLPAAFLVTVQAFFYLSLILKIQDSSADRETSHVAFSRSWETFQFPNLP